MSGTRWARIGFSMVAWLFAVTAIVQVYLAGQAVFGVNYSFELHRNVGYLIGVLGLVLVVLALAGRMPLRIIGAAALLLGLMVLQSVLVMMRDGSPNISALHPVNGFLITALALYVAWRALGYIRAPLPPARAHGATPPPPAQPPPGVADQED